MTVVEEVKTGPFWNRTAGVRRTIYYHPEELASDFEIFDSRKSGHSYAVDAKGKLWDFAVNWLTSDSPLSQFFPREKDNGEANLES